MANSNPFSSNNYDLGVGDAYGYDRDSATENILRSANTHHPKCYICNNPAHYKYVAKSEKYETATIQNGLYVCNHCITVAPISPKQYGIKKLD